MFIILNSSLFSSNSQEWRTPIDLFSSLDREFHFVLDACASVDNHLCDHYFTEFNSCLDHSWDFGGFVFCNPPYKNIKRFIFKAFYEFSNFGVKSVLLIPARTDTSYFHDFILPYAEIRFIRGRLCFLDVNGDSSSRAPFPSMIVIYR